MEIVVLIGGLKLWDLGERDESGEPCREADEQDTLDDDPVFLEITRQAIVLIPVLLIVPTTDLCC